MIGQHYNAVVGCKMIFNEHKLRYVLGVRTYARMYVRTYICACVGALLKTGIGITSITYCVRYVVMSKIGNFSSHSKEKEGGGGG